MEDRITFLCGDICDFARDYRGTDGSDENSSDGRWQGWDRKRIDVYVCTQARC